MHQLSLCLDEAWAPHLFFSFGCTSMETEYSIPYVQKGVHLHEFHMQDVSVTALSCLRISNSMTQMRKRFTPLY